MNYILRSMSSGALSGIIAQLFVLPLDFARTRLSADVTEIGKTKLYKGAIDCIRQSIKNDGFLSVYKGFIISGIF
jgi:hypothetical protein